MPDVLIVHGDPSIRALLRTATELEGYVCDEAENGVIGWNMMRRSAEPLIVLLNDLLPDLCWHDLLFVIALDSQGAARHAYIVTTELAAETARKLAELPEQLLVTLAPLPFDANTLAATIAEAAERLAAATESATETATAADTAADTAVATAAVAEALPATTPRTDATCAAPVTEEAEPLTLRLTGGYAGEAGGAAEIEIRARTRPGAALMIQVAYGAGRKAQNRALRGIRHADASGCYTWRWRPRAAPGERARVTVTASWQGRQARRVKVVRLSA